MESRKNEFKKVVTNEDGRRRRGDTVLQLRKSQKDEGIAKRRNMLVNNFVQPETTNSAELVINPNAPTADSSHKAVSVKDIPTLMAAITSQDSAQQISALRSFRRLLSTEKNPPVQQCIDCGVIPYFVGFLQRTDNFELQFEASWALTNIASTDRTKLVVECGALPHLINLLSSPNHDVREQSAWCLGNVAGDGPELRDFALKSGALGPIVANVTQPATISLLRNCTWSLSNFCRGKPQPDLALLRQALPVLAAVVTSCNDQDTIVDATWALSYISDGDNNRIQEVVNLNLIPSFVKMLNSCITQIIVPALRTLGNIVSGTDSQTQAVVESNVLPALVTLLSHNKKNIRKESCWMLSNIAAGNSNQLALLAGTPNLMVKVLMQMSPSAEWDVRKEATWVVSNIATGGNKYHIAQLVEHGAIKNICDLLDVGEVRILLVAMEALEAILKNAPESSNYLQLVDEAEGIERLENLQEHENHEVYQKAVSIVEKYFGGVEEESENLTPALGNNAYQFGIPTANTVAKLDSFNFNPTGQKMYDFSSF